VPATLVPVVRKDGYTSTDLVLVTGNSTLGAVDVNYSNAPVAVYGHIYVIQGQSGTDKLIGPLTLNVDAHTSSTDTTPVWEPWVDVVLAAVDDGASYWFLNDAALWTSNYAGTLSTDLHPVSGLPSSPLSLIDVNGSLFLGTNVTGSTGGSLYSAPVPAVGTAPTWTAVATGVTSSTGSYPVSFRTLLLNPKTGNLWVGTGSSGTSVVGNGYMDVTGLGGTPALSKVPSDSGTDNYSSTALSTQFVGGLFWGTNADSSHTLFLGTMADGLWAWSTAGTWSQQ
jgi:hypothetical protein